MSDHLINKNGTWHVRLAIPTDVQHYFGGRRILTKSLSTGSRSEAQTKKLEHLNKWKRQIQQARLARALPEGWQQDISEAHQTIAEGRRRARRMTADQDDYEHVEEQPELLINTGILEDPTIKEFIQTLAETQKLIKGDANLEFMLHDFMAEHVGDAINRSFLKRHDLNEEEEQEFSEIITSPANYKPKSPINKQVLELWQSHMIDQQTNLKTQNSHLSRLKRLASYLDETSQPLEFDTVHRFIISVSSASKTRKQYLWSGRCFWEWATRYHPPFRTSYKNRENPFNSHKIAKISTTAEKYKPFDKTQLVEFHKLALAGSDEQLADLIVFASYTGARISEIGNLTTQDIKYKNSTAISFQIEKAKTNAGIREVPVHRKLAPLIEKLVDNSEQNQGYLFRSGKSKYSHRLDYLSKRFTKMKMQQGFSDLYAFHSIRKTFITQLHQANVSSDMIPYLVGHKHHSFTFNIYSGGPTFKQKWDDIHKIEYDFLPHY